MRYLPKYVEQQNLMNRLFNMPSLSLDNPKDRETILNSLEGALSPENLCCDGELRGAALARKSKMLHGALAELKKL